MCKHNLEEFRVSTIGVSQCSRKRVQHLVFLDFQKKTFKTRKKRNHLITQPLIIPNYRKSVPLSHGHQRQTSCSEVWTQETMQLRTVCDKRL